jgi:hypothetical protein
MLVWIAAGVTVLLVAVALYDLTQRQRAILRTFPVIGHFRYWLAWTCGPRNAMKISERSQ